MSRRQPICWEDAIILAVLACLAFGMLALIVITAVMQPWFGLSIVGFFVAVAAVAIALRRWA